MNPWMIRIIIVILAIALLPFVVNGVAHLVTTGVNTAGEEIYRVGVEPFSRTGSARTEGVIRLCLYLIAGTLIIKYLLGRRGG